jgi:ribonuclease HII
MLKNNYKTGVIEAGCDEAGRGCLCGPVVAAAVILPEDFYHPLLNDSKKISEKNREILREIIMREAIAWGIGEASHVEIDAINILNASFLAMHRAIENLKQQPEHLIIDGNRFKPFKKIPHTCIVKGDSKFASIAAASILAKTKRDQLMKEIHERYPYYQWNENKGYATASHREAILKNGPCEYHRRSFTLIPTQYRFNF